MKANPIFFDYLKNILTQKNINLMNTHIEDQMFNSSYSRYMIHRYLSMSTYPSISNIIINNLYTLEKMKDNESHYKFLMKVIPKIQNSFIRYIK